MGHFLNKFSKLKTEPKMSKKVKIFLVKQKQKQTSKQNKTENHHQQQQMFPIQMKWHLGFSTGID